MTMGGARSAGVARASIEFDLAKLQAAVIGVRSASGQMTAAMNKAGAAAGSAQSKYEGFGTTVKKLTGEMLALTAATAALAAIGLKTASNIQNATIQLKSMTGSLEDANKLMDQMRAKGREAAVPFEQMIDLAIKLLPQLQGNTAELDRWIDLSRRLSVLNPKEGLSGAAFSIRETLSSKGRDLISLAERFNISRVDFRKALAAEGGDIAAAMDRVLTKMGITSQTAEELTTTFTAGLSRVSDAFNQLLGTAFTPFLATLTEVMERTAAWVNKLRDADPVLLTLTAGIIGTTAVLLPLVLLAERLGAAFLLIRGMGMWGGLGGLGGGAVGAAAGAAAPAAAGAGLGFAAAPGFTNLIQKIVGESRFERDRGEPAREANYTRLIIAIENFPQTLKDLIFPDAGTKLRQEALGNQLNANGIPPSLNIGRPSLGPGIPVAGSRAQALEPDQLKVVLKWQEDLADLEERFGKQRVQATEQFESQRANAIRSFGKTMVRETEDWARSQTRALENFQDSITDVRESAALRERLAQEDFDIKMQELREDHNKKIEDIERDFNSRREDLIDTHRDKILNLASRLDARGIVEENRRFNTAMKRIDRQEGKQKKKAEESVKDREKDAKGAFELRRKRAREADERRLEDMQDAFDEQQQEAEEDRAIRLQRMKDDHADQLSAMDDAHQKRLEQIEEQEGEAREKIREEFLKDMAEEGKATLAYIEEQEKREKAARDAFDGFWDHMLKTILASQGVTVGGGDAGGGGGMQPTDPLVPTPFARGGPVSGTNRALLHSGEFVMNRSVTNSLRAMMGDFNQADIMQAVAGGSGGSRNTSVRIAPGAIVVNEAQRPGMTASEVEGALISMVRSIT